MKHASYNSKLNIFVTHHNLPIKIKEYNLLLSEITILSTHDFYDYYLQTDDKKMYMNILNKVICFVYLRIVTIIESLLFSEYDCTLSQKEYSWLMSLHYYYQFIDVCVKNFDLENYELYTNIDKKINA